MIATDESAYCQTCWWPKAQCVCRPRADLAPAPVRVVPEIIAPGPPQTPRSEARTPGALAISGIGDVIKRVQAAGPRQFLVKQLIVASSYGVIGAQAKGAKTFGANDLGVSVVTGTPWFGHFEIPTPGPVVMFLGEGESAGTSAAGPDMRRLRRTGCRHRSHCSDGTRWFAVRPWQLAGALLAMSRQEDWPGRRQGPSSADEEAPLEVNRECRYRVV